jgi:hypothetical protein
MLSKQRANTCTYNTAARQGVYMSGRQRGIARIRLLVVSGRERIELAADQPPSEMYAPSRDCVPTRRNSICGTPPNIWSLTASNRS